jgi:hypothetical protein
VIVRAAPGLGASTSPSSRSAANWWRHLPTVTLSQPNSSAIFVFGLPSAPARTIATATPTPATHQHLWLFIGQLGRGGVHTSTFPGGSGEPAMNVGWHPKKKLLQTRRDIGRCL